MRLTVVVENQTARQGLYAEWGYSAWLKTTEADILFDTGGILHTLEHNLRTLGLNPAKLDHLVLSHGHFDHTSGVLDVLRRAPRIKIWAAESLARIRLGDADAKRLSGGGAMLAHLAHETIDPWTTVSPGVTAFTVPSEHRDPRWVCTKEMFEVNDAGDTVPDTFADDVSMVVEGKHGPSLLLGCAHAGLPNILRYASDTFGIRHFHTVLGGTHLSGVDPKDYPEWMEALKAFSVDKWRCNHCTGFLAAAELARHFPDVDWAAAGSVHDL